MPATIEAIGVERKGFATIDEAARFLRVGRTSLYAMLNSGSLPQRRLPGLRAVRIPWSALEAIVNGTDQAGE